MAIKEFRYTICPVGNASFLSANREGFLYDAFRPLGIRPVLLQSLPRDRWLAHFTYQDPALFREGGNVPPIWAKSNGTEVVLLGLTMHAQKTYILTRMDSPVDYVEELRHKKLALPTRPEYPVVDFFKSDAEHLFRSVLAARGVGTAEVEFVEIPASESEINITSDKTNHFGKAEADALEAGKVDAIVSSGVRALRLMLTGKFKTIFELGAHPGSISTVCGEYPHILTVSKQLADENPEVVVEYLKQTILAAEWAKTNLSGTLALFSKQLHATPGEIVTALPRDFYKHLTPGFSKEGLLALEGQKKFLYDRGYIAKDFPIEKWVDESFLRAALSDLGKNISLPNVDG
ncbi:ABC transporter substrate-binding protein [Caproiciproducens sp. CPB-2]|uniref:ABC transporter substrate-binding protein n=1 Tax=Caproiciproducens sp. CPB-2 TaxID=3030017 RepID=UPI0023D9AA99|nr:hypothetical protein [Caproiciproducens sp. CPB-2]MDF1493391.1 hypothetical protein [Caproiciproducens sp. CPB-2]